MLALCDGGCCLLCTGVSGCFLVSVENVFGWGFDRVSTKEKNCEECFIEGNL